MLNLNFVLQQLALPVDIERVKDNFLVLFIWCSSATKVDLNYPYYADDRLSIPQDQSRLYATKDDFRKYQDNLRMSRRIFLLNFHFCCALEKPQEIRFPTECVYLALHITHLGLVSMAKKPQRRNNIIRELNR